MSEHTYRVLTGEEFDESFLEQVMEIDRDVYEPQFVGELENMVERYRRNRRTFVCVMDGEKLAGYINFFPCTRPLWDDIVKYSPDIRDDDIRGDEIADYVPASPDAKGDEPQNNLFIISVAIAQAYRSDKRVVITLTNGWIDYLNRLDEEGLGIHAIAATAVSEDGRKFLRSRMFHLYRQISHGDCVYLCDGDYLRKLKDGDLYFKTHKDDIYMLLPYTDRADGDYTNTWRACPTEANEDGQVPPLMVHLMHELNSCMAYECKPDAITGLERVYLGSFNFLHTRDDYPDEDAEGTPDPDAPEWSSGLADENGWLIQPCIVGEETVYLSLLAHPESHMYVLMLYIPACGYSTSQVEDQCYHGYLKIRREEDIENGFYKYMDLHEYMYRQYELLSCGEGKCLVCMNARPKNRNEFLNILAGETYHSMHQDFHIRYPELEEAARDNLATYDYYEAYMTRVMIAFILKEHYQLSLDQDSEYESPSAFRSWPADGKPAQERMALMSTYLFIMELVAFQNTALNRLTLKVSSALSQKGDVSYHYITALYQDYARTAKFWQNDTFKYFGTQREASQIRNAFRNDELRESYQHQQELLEHMVDMNNAQAESRNGYVINIAAIVLAVLAVKNDVVEIAVSSLAKLDIEVTYADAMFYVIVLLMTALIGVSAALDARRRSFARSKKLYYDHKALWPYIEQDRTERTKSGDEDGTKE